MSGPARRVLVVEDESSQRRMYERAIAKMGFGVKSAESPADARRTLLASDFGVVLLDLNLAGESGMALFEELRETYPAMSVVIATGYGTLEIAREAIRMDVVDFLTKPVSLADLEHALSRAWQRHLLVRSPVSELQTRRGEGEAPAPFRDRESLNIEEAERDLILEALRRCDSNRKAAARMLGMSERKLYYRLSLFPSPPGAAEGRD